MKIKHFILLVSAICLLYFAFLNHNSKFITNNVKFKRTNFLILGTDFVDNSVHSDTVILLSYEPKNRVLDVISVPRDMYINFPEVKYKKLTEIFAYFYLKSKNKEFSAKSLKKILEDNFFNYGEKKIEIPYYILIDYENFKKFINSIGRIKILVTEPMHYDDFAGKLHIHFEPGIYYMDGEELLKYVRFRDEKGDIGRINRQQYFIKSLLRHIYSPVNIFKMPMILMKFKKVFVTNLNLWEVFNLALEFRNIKFSDIRFSVLEGLPKGRYLEVNEEQIVSIMSYLSNSDLSQTKEKLLIKIYNASSKKMIAKQVSLFLRDKGYDVLDWGNWYCRLPTSRIIEYTYEPNFLENLCKLLNIYEVSCIYSLEPSVDFAIILGEDFELEGIKK